MKIKSNFLKLLNKVVVVTGANGQVGLSLIKKIVSLMEK